MLFRLQPAWTPKMAKVQLRVQIETDKGRLMRKLSGRGAGQRIRGGVSNNSKPPPIGGDVD